MWIRGAWVEDRLYLSASYPGTAVCVAEQRVRHPVDGAVPGSFPACRDVAATEGASVILEIQPESWKLVQVRRPSRPQGSTR